MATLMLFLFVATVFGGFGFVAGRVWEIRSGIQSTRSQRIDHVLHHPARPDDLLRRSEPPMGF